MAAKKASEKTSAYLLKRFTKWINNGDSRVVTLWKFYEPYISQADQARIIRHFTETIHQSNSVPEITDDMVEEWTHD